MNAVEYIDEQDLNVFIDGSSLSSPRRGGVGTPLRANHTYRVRVNQDTKAPRIIKVLAEVEAR
jgi:ribonuclease HI